AGRVDVDARSGADPGAFQRDVAPGADIHAAARLESADDRVGRGGRRLFVAPLDREVGVGRARRVHAYRERAAARSRVDRGAAGVRRGAALVAADVEVDIAAGGVRGALVEHAPADLEIRAAAGLDLRHHRRAGVGRGVGRAAARLRAQLRFRRADVELLAGALRQAGDGVADAASGQAAHDADVEVRRALVDAGGVGCSLVHDLGRDHVDVARRVDRGALVGQPTAGADRNAAAAGRVERTDGRRAGRALRVERAAVHLDACIGAARARLGRDADTRRLLPASAAGRVVGCGNVDVTRGVDERALAAAVDRRPLDVDV